MYVYGYDLPLVRTVRRARVLAFRQKFSSCIHGQGQRMFGGAPRIRKWGVLPKFAEGVSGH
jgi:hypothetical protein